MPSERGSWKEGLLDRVAFSIRRSWRLRLRSCVSPTRQWIQINAWYRHAVLLLFLFTPHARISLSRDWCFALQRPLINFNFAALVVCIRYSWLVFFLETFLGSIFSPTSTYAWVGFRKICVKMSVLDELHFFSWYNY